jgi:hypothetical protein
LPRLWFWLKAVRSTKKNKQKGTLPFAGCKRLQ